jgi:hypothetical protein
MGAAQRVCHYFGGFLIVETKIVSMTPEWAQEILKTKNPSNRPVKNTAVAKLVKAIQKGEWLLTHQGIAFDWHGNLIDGQHRLIAIAKTGATVPINLSSNCDPGTFIACDIGTARTSSDVLTVNGVSSSEATIIGAAIGIVIRNARCPRLYWAGKVAQVSHIEILEYYDNWTEWKTAFKLTSKVHRGCKFATPSNVLALIVLARNAGHDWQTLIDFTEGLGSGANLHSDSALLAYRNYLQFSTAKGLGVVNVQQHRLACIVKAFNYYYSCLPLKQFKQPNYPPMPTICNPQ